jgi:hypothetical protein
VDEYQNLLMQIMRLADRVTMARLGLLVEMTIEPEEAKATTIRVAPASAGEWEKYPAYFRQTFAYIAASVRDGYAVLDGTAQPVEVE